MYTCGSSMLKSKFRLQNTSPSQLNKLSFNSIDKQRREKETTYSSNTSPPHSSRLTWTIRARRVTISVSVSPGGFPPLSGETGDARPLYNQRNTIPA